MVPVDSANLPADVGTEDSTAAVALTETFTDGTAVNSIIINNYSMML